MAKLLILFTIFFSTIAAVAASGSSGESHRFSRNLSPESMGLKEEKLSHLHFYFHDIISGPKPTAVRVAEAAMTNKSATVFGAVLMMDDPLTVGPEPSSKLVGRAQGLYASASQEEMALLMVLNFAFMEGKYNGSTLSVLGRNTIFSKVREMPIVGGSGLFRFARGEESYRFSKKNSPISMGLKEEKLSRLHFYFHDIVSGPEPTAVRVAEAAMINKSATVFMMDDLLIEGPEPNSKMVGKA